MKILKNGKENWNKPWIGKEGKCFYCGCIFLLDESDAPECHACQKEGDFYLIECPTCGNRVHIDK